MTPTQTLLTEMTAIYEAETDAVCVENALLCVDLLDAAWDHCKRGCPKEAIAALAEFRRAHASSVALARCECCQELIPTSEMDFDDLNLIPVCPKCAADLLDERDTRRELEIYLNNGR